MKRISIFLLLAAFISFHYTALGQPFKLLKDINESPWWSSTVGPRNLIATDNLVFFRQDTGIWRTDGTPVGTIFLKKIIPDKIVALNNSIFLSGGTLFVESAPGSGSYTGLEGIWKSDGTPAGTIQLTDKVAADNMTAVNDLFFFTGSNDINGSELWKSDGTEAGTVLVKDISVGSGSSYIHNLQNVNGTLYFNVGQDLWKSDGFETGTVLVKTNTTLNYPCVLPDGQFYFVNNGKELWISDGTDEGTAFIKQISTEIISSDPQLTFANGLVFFIGDINTAEAGLWKSDGTEAGTEFLVDVNSGFDGINSLLSLNDVLYFTAYYDDDKGALWRSDGTVTGTVMVTNSINIGFVVKVGDFLLFTNNDAEFGNELWKSDGTTDGTALLKDIYEGSGSSNPLSTDARAIEPPAGLGYCVLGNTLFFSAANGINGRELWKSNGTAVGTSMIKDIYRPNVSSNPRYLTKVNNTIYFTAYDRFASPFLYYHDELYKTDGTLSGTSMVRDLFGLGSGLPTELTDFKGSLYFSATDGLGFELFRSDGEYNNTIKLKDINPSVGQNSNPKDLTPVNDLLFFSANDGSNGTELWKTDGSEAGTVLVKNINNASDSDPQDLLNINGSLYFTADDGVNGRELWKSDGTEEGTVIIKNINGAAGSNPANLVSLNGTLFFTADDGINGVELWKSDGTDVGTVMVKNIHAGAGSSPAALFGANGILYFTADDGVNGAELWKSDGTDAGTVMVKDIFTGSGSSSPQFFTQVNSMIFFSAENETNGRELWKTDGTDAGTLMVMDIQAGISSSNPTVLTRVGSNLVFGANDGIAGNELWISNGSAAGTRMMQDIEPGSDGSDPSEIIEVNGKLLVSAFTSYFGRELWVSAAPAEIPLPLVLLEFKGSVVNNSGLLQWKTEHEYNTSVFILERSTDGRHYHAVASVPAANTDGVHYYDYTDPNINALSSPIVYYRLRQVDIDGQFTYSNIVTLSIDQSKTIVMVYPNPVSHTLNMTVTVEQKEKLQWRILDNIGRVVNSGQYELQQGSAALSVDVSRLGSGIYLLQLKGESIQEVIKLIKH